MLFRSLQKTLRPRDGAECDGGAARRVGGAWLVCQDMGNLESSVRERESDDAMEKGKFVWKLCMCENDSMKSSLEAYRVRHYRVASNKLDDGEDFL